MSEPISKRKRYVAVALTIVVLGAVVTLSASMWGPSGQTTDDAFVNADFTIVAPRVSGQVSALTAEDNQVVHKGQLLAQIDDRDYAAAVASADANVQMATAAIDHVSASITQQQSLIDQASATLATSRAGYAFARADFDRYTDLARQGAGTVQNAQQARSHIDSARADVSHAEASLRAARQQVAVQQAARERALATRQQAQAMLDRARLNLSWTRIEAPIDGTIGQRSVRIGAYVTPGTPLLAIVPLQHAYVTANFQETQLTDVRPGQAADIQVDMWPGRVLHGTVDSFAPATGVTFAAIAPDNATGNFTKIVQRIPVKIVLRQDQALRRDLRVGMSVQATIHTQRGASSVGREVAAR